MLNTFVTLILITRVHSSQLENKTVKRPCDALSGTTCECANPSVQWDKKSGAILSLHETYRDQEKLLCYIIELLNTTEGRDAANAVQDCTQLEERYQVTLEPAVFLSSQSVEVMNLHLQQHFETYRTKEVTASTGLLFDEVQGFSWIKYTTPGIDKSILPLIEKFVVNNSCYTFFLSNFEDATPIDETRPLLKAIECNANISQHIRVCYYAINYIQATTNATSNLLQFQFKANDASMNSDESSHARTSDRIITQSNSKKIRGFNSTASEDISAAADFEDVIRSKVGHNLLESDKDSHAKTSGGTNASSNPKKMRRHEEFSTTTSEEITASAHFKDVMRFKVGHNSLDSDEDPHEKASDGIGAPPDLKKIRGFKADYVPEDTDEDYSTTTSEERAAPAGFLDIVGFKARQKSVDEDEDSTTDGNNVPPDLRMLAEFNADNISMPTNNESTDSSKTDSRKKDGQSDWTTRLHDNRATTKGILNAQGNWSGKCQHLVWITDSEKICYVPVLEHFQRIESMHYNLVNKLCSSQGFLKRPWIGARIRHRRQISEMRTMAEKFLKENGIRKLNIPVLTGLIHVRGMGFIWVSGNNNTQLNSLNPLYEPLYEEMPYWIDPYFHPYLNTSEMHCHRFIIFTHTKTTYAQAVPCEYATNIKIVVCEYNLEGSVMDYADSHHLRHHDNETDSDNYTTAIVIPEQYDTNSSPETARRWYSAIFDIAGSGKFLWITIITLLSVINGIA